MSNSGNYVYKSQALQGLSGYSSSGYGAVPLGALSIDTSRNKMNLPGITFKITPANGGTIITVTEDVREKNSITLGGYEREELYIIPDGAEDFDRELGKIITLHRMKQQHE
jgi:hypothetical protein